MQESKQPAELEETKKSLPTRYRIKEEEKEKFLICVEEPNITVHVRREFSLSLAAAKKYPAGSIFLDGAVQGEPFMDIQRRVYNLDHHEGCIRAFTLATCEQALVLIRKGLDLQSGEWRLYGNEPDLDTVFSIWLFLNHRRLNSEDPEIRQKLIPLIRLQGIIDAHGLELLEISGFPEKLQKETLATIDSLRALEVDLKKSGSWTSMDELEYTASALAAIDELVYSSEHFDDSVHIEELERFPIGKERIGVVCQAEGIYEAEQWLRKLHGNRLGLLVQQKDDRHYTLRQTDSFLPINLEHLYERLNALDPSAKGDVRWGGSADIGGSPRAVGTRLGCKEIVETCQWVYQPPNPRAQITAGLWAGALALAIFLVPFLLVWFFSPLSLAPGLLGQASTVPYHGFLLGAGLFTAALLVWKGRRQARYAMLGKPKGFGWTALFPATLVAALLGGMWAPFPSLDSTFQIESLTKPLAGALVCELIFRGAIFAILLKQFKIMRQRGAWFLSIPTVVTAILSTLLNILLFPPPEWPSMGFPALHMVGWVLANILMGLACGFARERWASTWAPIALHAGSAVLVYMLVPLLPL